MVNKTTICIYFDSHFDLYTGIHYFFSISFHGKNKDKLRVKWEKYYSKLENCYQLDWQKSQDKEIEELQEKLSKAKDTFFKKPTKKIKESLEAIKDRKFRLNEYHRAQIAFSFVEKVKGVLISTGDSKKIYEV